MCYNLFRKSRKPQRPSGENSEGSFLFWWRIPSTQSRWNRNILRCAPSVFGISFFLVYVSGEPFWLTPEGQFEVAEQSSGLFMERIMLRTESGLQEICNGKMI